MTRPESLFDVGISQSDDLCRKRVLVEDCAAFSVLQKMLEKRQLRNLLTYFIDDVDCIVDIISDFQNLHPLIRAKQQGRLPQGE